VRILGLISDYTICLYNFTEKTMTTATYFAKSMVRKAREVNHASRKTKRSVVDGIEFLVLMTLPFFLPFGIMLLTAL
jgi:hypothetical protein|tara:strand:- start:27 stop:257 length:231 start_codon:yes stop_codon:yes gene_type:complete